MFRIDLQNTKAEGVECYCTTGAINGGIEGLIYLRGKTLYFYRIASDFYVRADEYCTNVCRERSSDVFVFMQRVMVQKLDERRVRYHPWQGVDGTSFYLFLFSRSMKN